MCAPKLGTVLAMYLREVVITLFIASPVAREGIGDPTTMLARSAVEVEPARTMGAVWKVFQHRSMFIGVKSTSSTIAWSLFPKAVWEEVRSGRLGADGCDIQAEGAVPTSCTDALRQ